MHILCTFIKKKKKKKKKKEKKRRNSLLAHLRISELKASVDKNAINRFAFWIQDETTPIAISSTNDLLRKAAQIHNLRIPDIHDSVSDIALFQLKINAFPVKFVERPVHVCKD